MLPFQVIYEDNHLLIVNKESGLLVQGDRTGDVTLPDLVKDWLREKYNKPGNIFCGVVHRLDRPVSGLVVLAKTSKALERMNALFRTRDIEKVYWAVVRKNDIPDEATLVNWLVKDESRNIVKAYRKEVTGSQRAELDYRILQEVDHNHYLLEVRPLTGRPHQIRVQLSAIGCPIRGDVKYGYPKPNANEGINLHSRSIRFEHPVKKEEIYVVASLPKEEGWGKIRN